MPRFSVIVPVYNVQDYLAQCLDSLLEQSFTDFEVLVIDDVSPDNSLQIARTYEKKEPRRFRLLCHSVNKGLGGARNTGIDAATGEYLLFLDSDDYLVPDALQKIDAMLQKTNADIVEFCFRFVDRQGGYLSRTHCKQTCPALTRSVNACNKAIRRELLRDVRFPEKRYYEDYCTVPKVLMSAGIVCGLDEALYCYRQHTASITHDTNIEKNRDILWGTDQLIAYFQEKALDSETKTQLEYLAIYHVLYHATLRVNGIDRKSDLQSTLKDYVQTQFPNHAQNPYRALLSPKEARLLHLIEKEKRNALYLRYHVRNRITGAVRRLLRKLKGK